MNLFRLLGSSSSSSVDASSFGRGKVKCNLVQVNKPLLLHLVGCLYYLYQ